MSKTVDARGLPCPQPVILTRNALKESAPAAGVAVVTIVDNETAQQNVTRMAEKAGSTVQIEEREDGIYLHINQGASQADAPAQPASIPAQGPLVLVIPSDNMGRGDAELGDILIRGFFHTLGQVESLPNTIIFFNSGVKLAVEGSPVLEDLQSLQEQEIEILACGTCLAHYELKEKVAVGKISNMYTIAETMLGAGKVISL
ncbi:MAG: sulfurtransferase-like selenium metabolism protein YedF [Chloroflexi bacterium]|nr:MAG: sulfurtransferase-like selenium metabolism protein YedF [Chloroflexota bacterium]HEY73760.1 sulfurtransferase-like selenium metabolism protein YedF [Thermoflexia bacterium]